MYKPSPIWRSGKPKPLGRGSKLAIFIIFFLSSHPRHKYAFVLRWSLLGKLIKISYKLFKLALTILFVVPSNSDDFATSGGFCRNRHSSVQLRIFGRHQNTQKRILGASSEVSRQLILVFKEDRKKVLGIWLILQLC